MASNGRVETFEFADTRDEILRRVIDADLDYALSPYINLSKDEIEPRLCHFEVFVKSGRNLTSVNVVAENADEFNALPFEQYVAIAPYRTFHFGADDTLEALLTAPANTAYTFSNIMSLPGIKFFRIDPGNQQVEEELGALEDVAEAVGGVSRAIQALRIRASEYTWALPIAGAPNHLSVEVSPMSKTYEDFVGPTEIPTSPMSRLTLKIKNLKYTTNDAVRELLEQSSSSILFELDLRFNLVMSLAYRGESLPHQPPEIGDEDLRPVTFPKVKYARPEKTIYCYGKQAEDAPLLRYLAYYQAIEYFFPMFVHRGTIDRVRNELRSPVFNWSRDQDVERVIRLATGGMRSGKLSEEQQLLTTLKASLDEDIMREMLDSASDEARTFFGDKNSLTGVPPIKLQAGSLLEQLAARMYALRCRIVHAKDSHDVYADPLLPFSEEAGRLKFDLLLTEMISRKVIIAGSSDTF